MVKLRVSTKAENALIDITPEIEKVVRDSGIKKGLCFIYVPHTTAGITINENADPSVRKDILMILDKLVPKREAYAHLEGNSPGHIKASLMGSSQTVMIEDGRLLLGRWQGIFLGEFDGPRERQVWVRLISHDGFREKGD